MTKNELYEGSVSTRMRKWYKASEAANIIGVSYHTLRGYVKTGRIGYDTTPGGTHVKTYY